MQIELENIKLELSRTLFRNRLQINLKGGKRRRAKIQAKNERRGSKIFALRVLILYICIYGCCLPYILF